MKNLISLLAVILLLASCEGPMGPRGPQGPQGKPGEPGEGVSWDIIPLTVRPGDWVKIYDNNNLFLYYQCIIDLPEMDEFVYDKGLYITYIRLPEGNNEVQRILPYTFYNETDGQLWQRTIDCDYMYQFSGGKVKSTIALYVKDSDFYDGNANRPGRMDFRVVLMW